MSPREAVIFSVELHPNGAPLGISLTGKIIQNGICTCTHISHQRPLTSSQGWVSGALLLCVCVGEVGSFPSFLILLYTFSMYRLHEHLM